MAELIPAFKRTVLGNEGPYDNNPKDPGGETVWGITRKYQPGWTGWGILNAVLPDNRAAFCKEQMGIPDSALGFLVLDFYRVGPWAAIRGAEIEDQSIAEELFDSGINCGMPRAITWLQRALNIFNQGGKDWPDMEVDGYLGNQTLECLNALLKRRGPRVLLRALDAQQGMHYLTIAEKNPNLEVFQAGWWLKRIG